MEAKKIKNIIIINGDILKFAPKKFAEKLKNYKLIGNIPYYLTSRLLRKFLEEEKSKAETNIPSLGKKADLKIENNGSLEEFKKNIETFFKKLQ